MVNMSQIINKINKKEDNIIEAGDIIQFDNSFYCFANVGKDEYRIIDLNGTGYWDDVKYPETTTLSYIQENYSDFCVRLYKHETIQLTIEQV
jgi:hypothetical protein